MAYSDNFPPQRAVFTLDAANAGRLDPRCSFTRASTGSYFGTAKHLSSENLIPNSNVSQAWEKTNTLLTTSGSFLNGSDSHLVSESSATGSHYIAPNVGVGNSTTFTIGTEYTVVLYAKSGTDNVIQLGMSSGAFGTNAYANYDLSNASTTPVTGSAATATITAMGSDWVKLTLTATATATQTTIGVYVGFVQNDINGARIPSYAGDTASNVYLWEANVSSTGQKVLNQTSGTIHREYQTKLQTAASGAARFEHSAIDGQSMGVLIESQATNLVTHSHELDNAGWTKGALNIDANAAISVDGTLTADLLRPTTASGAHYALMGATTTASSTYTASAYVKAAGYSKLRVFFYQSSSPYTHEADATFTLSGSGSATTAAGSSTISAVGGGYYRISVTGTAGSTQSNIQIRPANDAGSDNFAADGYSGIICTGVQFELGSHCSSLVSTSGATATRALDSLSADLSEIGYTGGPVSVVAEFEAKASTTQYVGVLSNTGYGIYTSYANLYQDAADTVRIDVNGSGGASDARGDATVASSAGSRKIAARYENDNYGLCVDGGTVATDTSGTLPVFDKLDVGSYADGGSVNSTIKRIALYGSLTDTNLQALTS